MKLNKKNNPAKLQFKTAKAKSSHKRKKKNELAKWNKTDTTSSMLRLTNMAEPLTRAERLKRPITSLPSSWVRCRRALTWSQT